MPNHAPNIKSSLFLILTSLGLAIPSRGDVLLVPGADYSATFTNLMLFSSTSGPQYVGHVLLFVDTNSVAPNTVLKYEMFETGTDNLAASGLIPLSKATDRFAFSATSIWGDLEGGFRLTAISGSALLTGFNVTVFRDRNVFTRIWRFSADAGPAQVSSAMYPAITITGSADERYQLEYADSFSSGTWHVLTSFTQISFTPRTHFDMSAAGLPQRFYRLTRPDGVTILSHTFTSLAPAGVPAPEETNGCTLTIVADLDSILPGTLLRYWLYEGTMGCCVSRGFIGLQPYTNSYTIAGQGWSDLEGSFQVRVEPPNGARLTEFTMAVVKNDSQSQRVKFAQKVQIVDALRLHTYNGLTITGTPRALYSIEYSNALSPTGWNKATDLWLPYSPYFLFDYGSSNQPLRHYRAVGLSP